MTRPEVKTISSGRKQLWLKLHRNEVVSFYQANGVEATLEEFNLQQESSITIRLIPDISAAALRSHQSKQVALWYILRAIDGAFFGASGAIDKAYIVEILVSRFGYSARSAQRHLAMGEGIWWHTYFNHQKLRVQIHGLAVVCKALGTALETDRHFRAISSEAFNSPAARKGQIYASIHKPAPIRANPISRQSISEHTGLSKPTQIRLERIAHVRKVANYAMIQQGTTMVSEKVEVYTRKRCYVLHKRLPNSYRSQQQSAGKGMLRSTSKRLRSLVTDEAPQLTKRYFKGVRSLTKALCSRGKDVQEGYFKLGAKYQTIQGRQEWVKALICA